tara:strand:+ start:10380 stop:12146 length:1767 start_codon:yes stop_codon:yes gene_type:complete
MKKSFITIATLALIASFANAEQVRVVVSQDKVDNSLSVSAKSSMEKSLKVRSEKTCLMTTDGLREICVPTPNLSHVLSNSTSTKVPKQEYKTITVDADNINQVIDTLNSTGWYNSVEVDVIVSSNTKPAQLADNANSIGAQSYDEPNDPMYGNQTYLHSEDRIGLEGRVHSNITQARSNIINKTAELGVAVLDSGFAENDELQFTGGYSFVTVSGETRDDDYGLNEGQDPAACGMHGFGVSSAMLATFDDAQTIAGIINGVNSYALRVMNCGTGYLSDTAAALDYLAKQNVDGAPMFTGSVQVANLSLGGQAAECPSYIQSAIDNANEAGITVVVAAGNDTINVSGFTPANCNGVVVVSSVSDSGELSSFSNYGDNTSIAAQGENILGFGDDEKRIYWWEGTSFAAPLVSASVALAKRDAPNLSPSVMRWLIKNTTSVLPDLSGECETLGCGSGLLDANALVLAAQKAEQGDLSSIRHALSGKSICDQQWYADYFNASAKLCSMYRVNFFDGFTKANTKFKLIRVVKGENFEAGESILLTELSSVLIQDIDTDSYDYGFKICLNGECSVDTYTFDIDAEKMTTPSACN